jgi:glycosyltransferase involved in cell wall biosynthesis
VTPLHIAVNASVIGDRPSGLGQYALNLIDSLQKLGCRLTVHESSLRLIRRDRGLARHAARLLWCQTVLRRRIHRERPTVLLNAIPEGVFSSVVPQVTVLHDIIPLLFPADYPRQQWYFRHLVPAMLRQSRMVITSSEATRSQAIATYGLRGDRIRTVHLGYDADRFRPDGPTFDDGGLPYILYLGNMLPHKNLPRLVDAFAVASERVRARLIIAGNVSPQQAASLRARAAACGILIELRPYVADDEVPALYRGAHAVVVPSLAEGFGLTALEAMASGTPVIVADASSLPEVVADAGIRVDPLDPKAIAAAIVDVLSDRALRDLLRERGLRRATTFSWERTAREVLAVLERAVCS